MGGAVLVIGLCNLVLKSYKRGIFATAYETGNDIANLAQGKQSRIVILTSVARMLGIHSWRWVAEICCASQGTPHPLRAPFLKAQPAKALLLPRFVAFYVGFAS